MYKYHVKAEFRRLEKTSMSFLEKTREIVRTLNEMPHVERERRCGDLVKKNKERHDQR
jgi:hypothetical protein